MLPEPCSTMNTTIEECYMLPCRSVLLQTFLGWPLEGKGRAADSPEAPGRAGCFSEPGKSSRALVSAGWLESCENLTGSKRD